MKAWRIWVPPAVCVLLFAVVLALDANRALFAVLNAWGPLTGDWLWANITVLGDTVVAFALCLPLWRRRPEALWAFVFVALLGTLWVHGLKHFLDVARPPAVLPDVHVIGPAYKAGSFPSGHATTAFAIGGLVALTAGLRTAGILAYCLVLALAALVALSRSVVGVHWPLDTLAGAFGGWLSAALGLWIGRRTSALGRKVWLQWAVALFLAACAFALVLGYPRDYRQANLLERAIGICCLGAAAARLKRAPG